MDLLGIRMKQQHTPLMHTPTTAPASLLKLSRLLALGLSLTLTACNLTKPTYQASVDLLHAGAKNGRLNHSDYELGRVLRLDRKNLRLTEVSSIPVDTVKIQRVPSAGEQDADTLDTLSEYDINLTTPTGTPVVDAGIASQVASHFRCDIQNYHTLQPDIEANALANDKTTLTWRQAHKDKLSGGGPDGGPTYLNNPNYIYAVVNKVYYSSKAEITTGAPDAADGRPGSSLSTKITVAGKELVNLSYKHQSTATRTGDKIPAIVYYDLYLLKPTPDGGTGAGIMFANIDNLYANDERDYQQIQRDFAQALRNSRTVE